MHLAELNIAAPKYPLDDPRMADFVDNLVRINTLGSKMPGFVWINKDESGHAFAQTTPWPNAAANLTVWESPEALEHFVWNTLHKRREDEIHETMYTIAGFAMHANARHDTVTGRLDTLEKRVDRLEEKV